ncbi:unnamed protein product [Chrysoparadoxa australica]
MATAEEDELYGDIDRHHTEESQKSKPSSREQEQELKIRKLEKQVALLEDQKEVLLQNMSCLYNTAKNEIERKNAMILELRKSKMEETERLIGDESKAVCWMWRHSTSSGTQINPITSLSQERWLAVK